jgi:hypothetical protein
MFEIEERVSDKKLVAKLEDVRMGSLDKASFKAVLRLQVFFTGRTHELILEFGKQAQALLLKHGNEDGVLDGLRGFRAQSDLLKAWGDTWKTWQDEFQAARREAVSIPFGVMAVRHEKFVRSAVEEQLSAVSGQQLAESRELIAESIEGGVFKPQLDILLNVAAEYLYGDSLNLSDRIWRVDRGARDAINNVVMQGIADGDSAWNIAKKLEQFLGAGEDCPRWTSTRLYGRTASDKSAGDTTGLLSGDACDGRGVSYNALRLARTEIQKAHSLATDRVMQSQPWVQMEQTNLSASHPETDECDDVVSGGDKGDGVYPVGTIEYPLHPNCFCYKTAVLMPEKEFTSSLNGWLKGESWPEMDSYAEDIGWGGSGDPAPSLMPNALSLAVWLFGENLNL